MTQTHHSTGRSGRPTDVTVEPVVRHLSLDLVDQRSGTTHPMPVDLAYDARDPWAVTLVFATDAAPIRWDFARDLLAEGMYDVVGDGDVHLWPCLDTEARAVVMIELEGADGSAVELQASSREVASFLAATEALVPRGTESAHVDLDALVGAILSEA